MEFLHEPVLVEEVLGLLATDHHDPLLIDATAGEGGHSAHFLEAHPHLRVVAVDADAQMLSRAKARLEHFGDRVSFIHGWFDDVLEDYAEGTPPSAVLFDLGISMFHYEGSERGFSFSKREVLDMRLQPDAGLSAADIVNRYSETELADTIYEYGEERYARRIAKAIVLERRSRPIETADHLADVVRRSVPPAYRYGRLHPATRTFQALRIAANEELDRLHRALPAALRVLRPKGRLGVIAFHSLEDRIAKRFLRSRRYDSTAQPDAPMSNEGAVSLLTKKPIFPSDDEVRRNPAARSARLRVAEKVFA
jgi:16S rRNA (cytosine1402-N4)-methyltransferase